MKRKSPTNSSPLNRDSVLSLVFKSTLFNPHPGPDSPRPLIIDQDKPLYDLLEQFLIPEYALFATRNRYQDHFTVKRAKEALIDS